MPTQEQVRGLVRKMADEVKAPAPSADAPAPASDTSKEHRDATMAGSLQAARSGPSNPDAAARAKRPREAGEADETDPPPEREKSARGGDAPAGGDGTAAARAPAAAAAAADDGDAREDARVGFPSQFPACGPHMHGWFLETHKRVFGQLLRGDDVKVILELGSW